MNRTKTAVMIFLLIGGTGCGGSSAPGKELSSWIGSEAHVVATGVLNGEKVDLDIRGVEVAEMRSVWCEREYKVPMRDGEPDYQSGAWDEFEIMGSLEGEAARKFEIEFMKHTFQVAKSGDVVAIVARDDLVEPDPSAMWLEWEWHAGDTNDVLFESSAQTGTFIVGMFSGEPDSTGLVIPEGEGSVAGYVSARWAETEAIQMSFTVPCGESSVEFVE